MSVRASLGQLLVRNWPIKLAAGFFAAMLYVAVAAQQPLAQTFAMRLAVGIPPGRTVRQQPGGVTVVITGKGSEILKLRSFPRVIRKIIPDTFSASVGGCAGGGRLARGGGGFRGFVLGGGRGGVRGRGPESRVNTLTRDSVGGGAPRGGRAAPGGSARLTVSAPPGIVAHAVPDSV